MHLQHAQYKFQSYLLFALILNSEIGYTSWICVLFNTRTDRFYLEFTYILHQKQYHVNLKTQGNQEFSNTLRLWNFIHK